MKLNRTPNPLDRNARNGENDNWDIIEGETRKINDKVDNFLENLSEDAFNKVIDDIRFNWSHKVDNFADLPSNPKKGETVAVENDNMIYRYDGSNWIDVIPFTQFSAIAEVDSRLSSQLAETEEKNPNNAQYPLIIRTYDGFNRTVHPDVVYFANGWNGYKYWMVHTPFPFDNDFWENPSIIVSNDGVKWNDAPGITNPIDEVTEEENDNGIYLSDAILVYANDRLECFYRWYNKNTREEKFYRQYSLDGSNWQGKEVVLDKADTELNMILSPSIVYENGKYRMWAVDNPSRRVMYTESTDAKNWSDFVEIPLQFTDRVPEPWHLHVFKESNNLYHLTMSEYKSSGPRSIFHGISIDGNSFSGIKEILKTKEGASWDNGYLYRPSLTKVDGRYKLYYSARAAGGVGAWRIGLVEGNTMETLRSTENYDEDFNFEIPRIVSEYIRSDEFQSRFLYLVSGSSDYNVRIKMLDRGRAGVNLVVGRNNELKILADNEKDDGDIAVRKITVDGIELYVHEDELRLLAGDGSFRDLGVRNIKLSRIRPHSYSTGITAVGKTTFQNEGEYPPILKLLHVGKYGAELRVTNANLLEVFRDSGVPGGHMRMASLVLDGNAARTEEGSIRYNKDTKKHQGYDGTKWNDLY